MRTLKKIAVAVRRFVGWLPPSIVPLVTPGALALATRFGLHVSADFVQQIILSVLVALGTHAIANTTNPVDGL